MLSTLDQTDKARVDGVQAVDAQELEAEKEAKIENIIAVTFEESKQWQSARIMGLGQWISNVFLHSQQLQMRLVSFLKARFQLPYAPLLINGEVSGVRRKALVDDFQRPRADGFDVFLLGPKSGGLGLTLTAANHVIHLDRWWNPAVEDQCTDRVYRIG